MELVTYDSGAKFGYYLGSEESPRYQASQFGNKDYWRVYSVSLAFAHDDGKDYQTVDGQQYTDSQMYSALSEKNYTLTASRTADSNSIAKFWTGAASSNALASGEQPHTFLTSTAVNSTNFGTLRYVGIYVDGADHTKDSTSQTGNFTVTFAIV